MMEITILQSDGCAFCDDADEIVERLASEFPIDVVKMDLGSPEGARLAAGAGVLFPPGLLLDGDLLGYGRPSERRLRRKIAQQFADGARLHAKEQRHAEVQEP